MLLSCLLSLRGSNRVTCFFTLAPPPHSAAFQCLTFVSVASPVPSASMTRLARSRTASLTSAGSVEGSRSRPCTHSDSSDGVGQLNHTMEVSC